MPTHIREPPTVAQTLPRARTSIIVAIACNGTLMTPIDGESAEQAPPQLPVGRDVGVGVGVAASCRLGPQESTDSSGDCGGAEHDGNQQYSPTVDPSMACSDGLLRGLFRGPFSGAHGSSPPRRYGLSLNDLDELVAARPVGQWRSPAALVDRAGQRLRRPAASAGSAVIAK